MNISFNQHNIVRVDIAGDDEIVLCEIEKRIKEYALECNRPFLIMENRNVCDPDMHIMVDEGQAMHIRAIINEAIEETKEKCARRDFILETLADGTNDMRGVITRDAKGGWINIRYTLNEYPQAYLTIALFHNIDDMTIDENYLYWVLKNIRYVDIAGESLSEEHIRKVERFASAMIDKLKLKLKSSNEGE